MALHRAAAIELTDGLRRAEILVLSDMGYPAPEHTALRRSPRPAQASRSIAQCSQAGAIAKMPRPCCLARYMALSAAASS